jgi:Family of unknown function (DUF6879)
VTGRRIALNSPDYAGLFSFQHTAYRLETRPVYRDESEREPFAAWLAGGPAQPDQDWLQFVRDATGTGKVMRRVHVIEEPRTSYLDFELELYRFSVEAGESVGIIPVTGGTWPAGLPHADYWLFDSRILAMMIYSVSGRPEQAVLVEDPARIVEACHWRDAAWHAAMPYADYMKARQREPAA